MQNFCQSCRKNIEEKRFVINFYKSTTVLGISRNTYLELISQQSCLDPSENKGVVDFKLHLFYRHIDGHHKLVRWRFVIHGGIDGISRSIVYLRCCSNNKAETVLALFLDASERFGLPSRVRSELGTENVEKCT